METSEVRVAFFATDENNRPVVAMGKDDFAVVDNGVVMRDFRSLTRSAETALDIVVVVDASDSVTSRFRATANQVLELVSEIPQTDDGRVAIVSFSGLQPELLCAGDCRTMAGQRLLAITPAGPTPLFDALVFAARLATKRQTPGVRQVLILISDGNDTISKSSVSDALEAVYNTGALLYAVDLNQSGHDPNSTAVLRHMAEATGGRVFAGEAGTAGVLLAALADLHASYVVTYQLPNSVAGFHSLHILPKHNLNLKFHCRSGYYYEKPLP